MQINEIIDSINEMSELDRQQAIKVLVSQYAVPYHDTIMNSLTIGVKQALDDVYNQKMNVETGLIVLLEKVNISKLSDRFKPVLLRSLKACGAYDMTKQIEETLKVKPCATSA